MRLVFEYGFGKSTVAVDDIVFVSHAGHPKYDKKGRGCVRNGRVWVKDVGLSLGLKVLCAPK